MVKSHILAIPAFIAIALFAIFEFRARSSATAFFSSEWSKKSPDAGAPNQWPFNGDKMTPKGYLLGVGKADITG